MKGETLTPVIDRDDVIAYELPRPDDVFAGKDLVVFLPDEEDHFETYDGYIGFVPGAVEDDRLAEYADEQMQWFFWGNRDEMETLAKKKVQERDE